MLAGWRNACMLSRPRGFPAIPINQTEPYLVPGRLSDWCDRLPAQDHTGQQVAATATVILLDRLEDVARLIFKQGLARPEVPAGRAADAALMADLRAAGYTLLVPKGRHRKHIAESAITVARPHWRGWLSLVQIMAEEQELANCVLRYEFLGYRQMLVRDKKLYRELASFAHTMQIVNDPAKLLARDLAIPRLGALAPV